jgi:CBS domain containing-hemolysin-like protein
MLLTSVLSRNKAGQSDRDYTSLIFAKGEIGIKGDESPGLAPGIGGADSDEIKLFQNALEFTNVKVRDCMIPRTEITASEINSSMDEIMQKFIETGFSKILIYEHTIDNILGYVTSKELFNKPATLKSVLHNISFVIENMTASKLLRKFIQEGKGIAVVVDEFGGVAGLITIEDVMEEIFGEIEDEHDTDEFVEKKTGDKEYIFSGRLETDHINEKYGLGIPENEEYSTLAGFIMYHHGNIPRFNDIIRIGDFSFKIIKAGRNRVELVKLTVEK